MLVGTVAHDLNNVLSVITSFSTFVAEDIGAAQRDGCTHLGNALADMEKVLAAARHGVGVTRRLAALSEVAD